MAKVPQTARSIQVAILHTCLGIYVGASIEALLPKHVDGASLNQELFETVVQVGLNGAALSLVAASLMTDDPTFGIPFSMALFQAQPELAGRIRSLAAVAKGQVAQAVQRTAPLVPTV